MLTIEKANQISAATARLNNILRGMDIPDQLDQCDPAVRKMIVDAAYNIVQNIEADAQLARIIEETKESLGDEVYADLYERY